MFVVAIVPCYKTPDQAPLVVSKCLNYVDKVICVDDYCPLNTGNIIKSQINHEKVSIIKHQKNMGVGGAVKTGIIHALNINADIIVKVDSDGQMSPELIPYLIEPIIDKKCSFAKGNRFRDSNIIRKMQKIS